MENKLLLKAQRNEITEHEIYKNLAEYAKGKNKQVLKHIANDEKKHYNILKEATKQDVRPNKWRVQLYSLLVKIFGLAFGLQLMERGARLAKQAYKKTNHKRTAQLLKAEEQHEKKLREMLKDIRLKYAGNIVIGLNDALVSLTGALTGYTITLQSPKLVAATGFITGFAGALSIAASGYLQAKEEKVKMPTLGGLFTGTAFLATVLLLVAPFILLGHPYYALGITWLTAIMLITGYTYYISIAKQLSLKKRFLEMLTISGSVIIISTLIGFIIRTYIGVQA